MRNWLKSTFEVSVPPIVKSPEALRTFGPSAFGFAEAGSFSLECMQADGPSWMGTPVDCGTCLTHEREICLGPRY